MCRVTIDGPVFLDERVYVGDATRIFTRPSDRRSATVTLIEIAGVVVVD